MSTIPRRMKRWLRWVVIVGGAFVGGLAVLWVLIFSMGSTGIVQRAPEDRAVSEMVAMSAAMESYRSDHGSYPVGEDAAICRELTRQGKKIYLEWQPSRVSKADGGFLDPWGTPYRIRVEGEKVNLRSAGRDRKFTNDGAGDDVVVGD